MLISYSWLKDFVELPDSVTPETVAEKLKLSTVEVEGITRSGQPLNNIVAGKIISAEKHPNADKLKVCKVDVGQEILDVVCGGSNVEAGMTVIVAKNGAKVKWHGEGELVELAPTKIRGVESNGMICGADEVGLNERFPKKSEKEIVDLSSLKVKPGTPLEKIVGGGDVVFEIDNKSLSNRPDLWGHVGLAREVSVLTDGKLGKYETKPVVKGKETLKLKVEDEKLCTRYMAVKMDNIKVTSSPAWLLERLTTVGLRPINNIVDVMNYVMLELGQPMHAFDAEYVKEGIVVREAQDGETLVSLDEKERKLAPGMLLITSNGKPVAIAGIIGGLESAVKENTVSIVIESANFNPVSIRQTSTKLSLRTDASARFEKGLDPNMCVTALEKAVSMIGEIVPGAVVASKVVDVGSKRSEHLLELPVKFFEQKIGQAIEIKTIVNILQKLGFAVEIDGEMMQITVPTWRAKDVSRAEDLVEEVVRMFGYENISSALPYFEIIPAPKNNLKDLQNKMLDLFVREFAFTEVYNYSFVSEQQIEKIGDRAKDYLSLNNPLSNEKPYLRRELILNLLENVEAAMANRDVVKLVEIGQVFRQEFQGARTMTNGDELLPRQDVMLTAVFSEKKNQKPFQVMRGLVEAVEESLGIKLLVKAPKNKHKSAHPLRQADLFSGEALVGSVLEIHPEVAGKFGLSERLAVLNLNLSELSEKIISVAKVYYSASLYPEVRRDISVLLKKDISYERVSKVINESAEMLKSIELFDSYEGEKIGKGYKSLALHLTFSSPDKTLTTEEINKSFGKIVSALEKKLEAEIRV